MARIALLIIFFVCASIYSHAQTATPPAPPIPTTWKKRVVRTINLAEKEDTAMHLLSDVTVDSPLVQMLTEAVLDGHLTAYWPQDIALSTPIPFRGLRVPSEIMRYDTTIVVDPVTGDEYKKLRERYPDWNAVQKLRVVEDWTYDLTGNTKVEIIAIGPAFDEKRIIFWTRYKKAKKIIDRYDQYHPNNTLSQHIWNNYFSSDIRPKDLE